MDGLSRLGDLIGWMLLGWKQNWCADQEASTCDKPLSFENGFLV